jgi:hypothetical protein
MTKNDKETRIERVVIALTLVSPLQKFWQEALQLAAESRAELHALLLEDARWLRAASLPFTDEIPRLGGAPVKFTMTRARQLQDEATQRIRQELERLAAEGRRELSFEVLPESNSRRISDLARNAQCIVIAPEGVAGQPAFDEIRKLGCRVILIRE